MLLELMQLYKQNPLLEKILNFHYLPKLYIDFNDDFTYNLCRPLAYSTLADLVHHVRQQLPLQHLSMAVHLFSKNVHDESLPCNIQTMSCKLLLNLVECIRQKSEQDGANVSVNNLINHM